MSIQGQSFNNDFATGAHVDFGVGTAGLATAYAAGFTVAVLARFTSSNWGLLGAYSDAAASAAVRQFFVSNNSGGRLFGDGDFSGGYPDVANDADGINDGVWRWHAMSKAAGTTQYRMHYADLATLTWNHGVAASAGNHTDATSSAVLVSTWAIYPQGFSSGDIAAIAVFNSNLSDAAIVAACTKLASDLAAASPVAGWLFPQATAGSAVSDFTGGGANESSRQNIATSADPPGFNFSLGGARNPGGDFLPFFH